MKTSPQICETDDGSKTCLHHQHKASYRSLSGAVAEVQHVFIDSTIGGPPRSPAFNAGDSISVLEFGFGLGTSFAETLLFAQKNQYILNYLAFEREPVLGQFAQHPCDTARTVARQLLDQLQDHDVARISGDFFNVQVVRADFASLPTSSLPPFVADAIFFDPFGPEINPESWTKEIFECAAGFLADDGRLATYSAAGHVRRALAAAGWVLATRPGPARKREITVAALNDNALLDFERLSMKRYLRHQELA